MISLKLIRGMTAMDDGCPWLYRCRYC